MEASNLFYGIHQVSMDPGNRTHVPHSFRKNLTKAMGGEYYLLISKTAEEDSKILTLEPILKAAYHDLLSTFKGSELQCFSGKVTSEVKKNGTVTLTSPLAKFIGSEEGDNYYFVGCGDYFELHKSQMDYTKFENMIRLSFN